MKSVIEDYLRQKGWEYKESGNEQFLLKTCPMCGSDRFHHFYIGQYNGLWDCKACGQKGNLNQLRHNLGDEYIDLKPYENQTPPEKLVKTYVTPKYDLPLEHASRLWGMDTEAQKYLTEERKLTKEVLEKFKIGATPEGNISIPVYEDGKLVNIRYRFSAKNMHPGSNQRYTQEKGCRSPLYNTDAASTTPVRIYITEGEFDALQLIQRGIHNTMSTTLGASSFPDAWVEVLKDIKEIYFVYDTDEEGYAGAKKAAEKLGIDRCKYVRLPSIPGEKKTDVTDFFVKLNGTKDSFLELVDKAEAFTSATAEDVRHISEFSPDVRNVIIEGEHYGISTGYAELDELMGGLRKGRMVILSGLTNTGKSSFAANICLNLAHHKNPSYFLSMEMPPIDIVRKVLQLESKLTSHDLRNVPDPSATLTKIDQTLAVFPELPIYLYAGSGVIKYEILDKTVRHAVVKHGVQVVFVDHLHYFAQNYNNLAADTSKIVRQIKQLAVELNITIVLLAHLNRGGRAKERRGMYTPTLADLKETSTIEQDADQVLFVCRDSENKEQIEREKAFIKIAKNRDGQAGGQVSMTFSEEITTFIELTGVNYEKQNEEKQTARTEEEQAELKMNDLPF